MARVQLDADSTTLILNGTAVNDFQTGDFLELTPANPLSGRVNASNGGFTANKRSDSGVHNLVVRVHRFSASDVFLNNIRRQESLVVIDGSIKEDFTKDGIEGQESYILEGGTITTQPTIIKNNADGNSVVEYTIEFREVSRNL